jgi:hypothetical protein
VHCLCQCDSDIHAPVWHWMSVRDSCLACVCCWSSPAQSFSGPSPAGLMTSIYCLRFETPPTWRARSPYLYTPGTGWACYTPRHWVPFSSPPTTRATMEVFDPASIRDCSFLFWPLTPTLIGTRYWSVSPISLPGNSFVNTFPRQWIHVSIEQLLDSCVYVYVCC